MPPYFETVKSFTDVPFTHEGIETQSFLEASEGLVKIFDLFGFGVFGFVQADIRSNLNGVRVFYESKGVAADTLEKFVKLESSETQRDATGCLVRLIRGLAVTCNALQYMQKDTTVELHVCFRRAYDEVLWQHHSWVIRSVVYVAIRAVPRRHEFYTQIAQGGSTEKLDSELAKWLSALDRIVKHMRMFLEEGGFGRV